jgi:hypothetical protein
VGRVEAHEHHQAASSARMNIAISTLPREEEDQLDQYWTPITMWSVLVK